MAGNVSNVVTSACKYQVSTPGGLCQVLTSDPECQVLTHGHGRGSLFEPYYYGARRLDVNISVSRRE